jgi:hypothetical protein
MEFFQGSEYWKSNPGRYFVGGSKPEVFHRQGGWTKTRWRILDELDIPEVFPRAGAQKEKTRVCAMDRHPSREGVHVKRSLIRISLFFVSSSSSAGKKQRHKQVGVS